MLIRNFFILILVCLVFISCRKDFFAESGPGQLSFSNDSILFDTIFTTIGSATKKFVVYNNNNNPVTIETIRLVKHNPYDIYRINIDGMPIGQSQNIKLAPNDSLFIFIEVTINPNNQNTPFLVSNSLEFITISCVFPFVINSKLLLTKKGVFWLFGFMVTSINMKRLSLGASLIF